MPEEAMLQVNGVDARHGDVQALWDVSLEVREARSSRLSARTARQDDADADDHGAAPAVRRHHYLEGAPIHTLAPRSPSARDPGPGGAAAVRRDAGAGEPRSGRVRPRSSVARRADTLAFVFETFPILAERRQQLAGTLSGGQQQMLAIGRALMGLPRLLLLDEPSLGLAPIVVQQIFRVIETLGRQRGVTVLLVEQNARLALEVADRAYVLEQGRVASTAAPPTC